MTSVRDVGTGDALIGLGLAVLVVAALLPTYRARAFQSSVAEAVADVDALRAAALRFVAATGEWPPARPPGSVPAGASGSFGGDTTMVRDAYMLQWTLLERVEHVEAPGPPTSAGASMVDDDEEPLQDVRVRSDPPPDSAARGVLLPVVRMEGAVVVHSGDDLLLAELLRHFGDGRSFVRDTTWTLVVLRP
ncbi:MAG: hypothetical protein R3304_06565 [Longimicrobiales bacterium]|nr:hypothetical protein [Longimicrobiales bacterium]